MIRFLLRFLRGYVTPNGVFIRWWSPEQWRTYERSDLAYYRRRLALCKALGRIK